MKQSKTFYLAALGCVFTLGVILLGSYTRLTDAGLGCPDWPGCYGHLAVPSTPDAIEHATTHYPTIPIESKKAWTEMVHRYFAGTLGLIVFGVAIASLRAHRKTISAWLPCTLIALIIFQAALGMWTVTLKLLPVVVMGHLLGGFFLFGLLGLTAFKLRTSDVTNSAYSMSQHIRPLQVIGLFALLLLIGQIFLGGWTSSNYAALVCPDFPTCLGRWWPTFDSNAFNLMTGVGYDTPSLAMDNHARIVIQATHRLGALILSGVSLIFMGLLWRARYRAISMLLFALLSLQITLGVSNVLYLLPLPVAVMHTGVGALLFLAFLYANHLIWKKQ